jgi:hypothetical protein
MKFQGQPVNPATAAKFDPSTPTPQIGTPSPAANTNRPQSSTQPSAGAGTSNQNTQQQQNVPKSVSQPVPPGGGKFSRAAAATVGGLAQTAGAAIGGFQRGFHGSRSGKGFKWFGGDYKGDNYKGSPGKSDFSYDKGFQAGFQAAQQHKSPNPTAPENRPTENQEFEDFKRLLDNIKTR